MPYLSVLFPKSKAGLSGCKALLNQLSESRAMRSNIAGLLHLSEEGTLREVSL